MYGLPKSFDPASLLGRCLEQICINQNQLWLRFDAEVSICVESAFLYKDHLSPERTEFNEIPVRYSGIMKLLGENVVRAVSDDNSTLTLGFGNGDVFQCFDNSKQYESYKIVLGDRTIVV